MNVTRTLSQQHLNPGHAPQQDQQGGIKISPNGTARASQQTVVDSINTRLGRDRVSTENLLSRVGIKSAIGRASGYANLKDGVLRLAHRINNHLAPDPAVGSNHKAAIRLGEQYHQLKSRGAPDTELLPVLNQLKAKLEIIQQHRGEDGHGDAGPVLEMIRFVESEIQTLPCKHLEEADRLAALLQEQEHEGAQVETRLETLRSLKLHLEGANPEGTDNELNLRLAEAHRLLVPLENYQPLDKQLQDTGTRLRPTHVDRGDEFATAKQEIYFAKLGEDPDRMIAQGVINQEIQGFSRDRLKHVTTHERTGFDSAAETFRQQSHQVTPHTDVVLGEDAPPPLEDPSFQHVSQETLQSETFQSLGSLVLEAVANRDDAAVEHLSKTLGELMAQDLRQLTEDQQLGFITSKGPAFKEDLHRALAATLGDGRDALGASFDTAPFGVQLFINKAYTAAVSQLSNHMVDPETCVLNGRTYHRVDYLNHGGLGIVDLYEARWTEVEDGKEVEKTERIVLKYPTIANMPMLDEETAQPFFEISAREARSHHLAHGEGHPNIVGYKGAFLSPNGLVFLAMELAPGGDVAKVGDRITDAEQRGNITPESANLARLTLLRDMLEGMQHVQETRGMLHLDIKPENFLVGEDGRAKVADFGFSLQGTRQTFQEKPIDNTLHLAPEVLSSSRAIESGAPLPGEEEGFVVTGKSDTWALGITAFQLFHANQHLFATLDKEDPKYQQQVYDAVLQFGTDSDHTARPLGTDGSGNAVGRGAGTLDRLINQMLHPDPQMRPSITDLLQHPIFQEPGIGSTEVRNLIQTLNRKESTPEEIRNASREVGV